MGRRLISFLVLGILLAAHAAPLTAGGRHCGMERDARVAVCPGCGDAAPNRAATVSATSCCRFEAASPRSTTPGVLPSIQRAQDSGSAAAFMLACVVTAETSRALLPARSPSPPLRSSDTPITLNSTLRL